MMVWLICFLFRKILLHLNYLVFYFLSFVELTKHSEICNYFDKKRYLALSFFNFRCHVIYIWVMCEFL